MSLNITESQRCRPGGVVPYEINSTNFPPSTATRLNFWQHRKQILKRCRSDSDFRQMWWHYRDVLVSLGPVEDEADELRRVRDELEAKIIYTLH